MSMLQWNNEEEFQEFWKKLNNEVDETLAKLYSASTPVVLTDNQKKVIDKGTGKGLFRREDRKS